MKKISLAACLSVGMLNACSEKQEEPIQDVAEAKVEAQQHDSTQVASEGIPLNQALALSLAGVDILDERANALLSADTSVEVLGEGYGWSEGPVWVKEGGYLLFSDIPNHRVHKYVPGEPVSVYLEDSGFSNGLLINHDNELVLMQSRMRGVAKMQAPLLEPKAQYMALTERFEGKRLNSPNDVALYKDGSLYFTDPPYGLPKQLDDPEKELDFQGVYRLDAQGQLSLLDKTLSFPNGIAFSRDYRALYVAVSDPKAARWYRYDVGEDGSLSGRTILFDASDLIGQENIQGLPDGLKVHSSGMIFATGPGGVFVFDQDGKVIAKIRTPFATANCAFSADEKVLYMTAHKYLLAVKLK